MSALIFLITSISSLIFWLVIIHVILSWLISFNIVNMNNQFVYQLYYGLERALQPLLKPIRAIVPSFGGLDLSPIILIIGVRLIEILLIGTVLPILFG